MNPTLGAYATALLVCLVVAYLRGWRLVDVLGAALLIGCVACVYGSALVLDP